MPAPELTLAITFAVLGAGLLHAGWNALLKSAPGGDPLLDTATVVAGSTMFPRDRVIQSLQKYGIGFSESGSTEHLSAKLAEFYAQRTLTKQPILPQDCANAIVWLASDQSAKTTGHVIPVDGGVSEAFLR